MQSASSFAVGGSPPAPVSRSSLQSFNQELVKCLEEIRERREEVNRAILADEEERAGIQKQLSMLTDKLNRLNENLARKMRARDEFDRTLKDSQDAYDKIVESSQSLLNVLQKESKTLGKKR